MRTVVIGSSQGIGREIAKHLVDQGHEVWGVARHRGQDCVSNHFTSCDVSVWQQVESLAEQIGRKWSSVNAFINCAAIHGPIGPTINADPDEWLKAFQINIHGIFFSIKAFYKLLVGGSLQGQGHSKFICFSGGGAASPRPFFSAYATSKAAAVRLVENIAEEWKAVPIDINIVAPGALPTRLIEEVLNLGRNVVGEKELAQASKSKQNQQETMQKVLKMISFLISKDSDGVSGKLIAAQWDPIDYIISHKHELAEDMFTLRRVVPS
ncbi:MAG: SDR family oxidoreductase [Bdellovibrionota bacterium]